jgi:hypothetical protein
MRSNSMFEFLMVLDDLGLTGFTYYQGKFQKECCHPFWNIVITSKDYSHSIVAGGFAEIS